MAYVPRELLERGLHPKLPAKDCKAYAKEIRDSATYLRSACEKARTKVARAQLLERVRLSMARAAQVELINLKRRYKAEAFSEPEIHAVIPDRASPAARKPSPPTTPVVSTT